MFSIKWFELDLENSVALINIKAGMELSTSYQISLPSEFDDEPHTTIKYVGLSEYPHYDKYLIFHERYKSIQGRYRNEAINYYIAVDTLELYKSLDNSHVLIKGTADSVSSAMEKLSSNHMIKVKKYAIDLLSLIRSSNNFKITGGWIGKLKYDNIDTAALFGPSTGDNFIWEQIKEKGEITALQLQLTHLGTTLDFMVSQNGNLLLYNKWVEAASLHEVSDLLRQLDRHLLK